MKGEKIKSYNPRTAKKFAIKLREMGFGYRIIAEEIGCSISHARRLCVDPLKEIH